MRTHWRMSSLCLSFLLPLLACSESRSSSPPPSEVGIAGAALSMVERLDSLADAADRERTLFQSDARVAALQGSPTSPDLRGTLTHQIELADELLRAGRFEEAIATYDSITAASAINPSLVPRAFSKDALELAATTYLHRSIQDHCVNIATAGACTFPIRPGAGHEAQADAREAIRRFEAILEEWPEDLRTRWLLNLAYMAVAEYPERVPSLHLIPPAAFQSEYDVGRFPDVAPALGVDIVSRAGAGLLDDFDGDGLLDVVMSSVGLRDPMHYFRNEGDGTFSERTEQAGLAGLNGGLNAVHGDYDNDGYLDIFVLRGGWHVRGHPNSLLRNRGDGTFEDVTESVGLLEAFATQTAVWGDFDNDGRLDLFVGNETQGGRTPNPAQLFFNDGEGHFADIAGEAGVSVVGFVKGVTAGDYDNDGWLDLYVSRLGGSNLLFHNEGKAQDAGGTISFTEVSASAGVSEPIPSFPTWFFDFDNDGWLDLFVSGYQASSMEITREYLGMPIETAIPKLYRNAGDGTFEDVTAEVRLERVLQTMGANFGDLDNDGFLDFYVGTGDPNIRSLIPNRMFRNAHGVAFQDVTTSGGFGLLAKGHGVGFGDVDNDGDQDIYVTMGAAYQGDQARNAFFANPGHGNRWITLRLEGTTSNRSAIGARIRVRVTTSVAPRDVYSTVNSGGSFGGSSLQQEIGLGDAQAIEEVEIWWPTSGRRDRYPDVPLDRVYRVVEGADQLGLLTVHTFDLTSAAVATPR